MKKINVGLRIRDNRISMGLRQGELAEMVGVSPSYLNLIEHGKRRIGGKLLVRMAQSLGVDPTVLSDVTAPHTLAAVNQVISNHPAVGLTPPDVEKFCDSHSKWAEVIAVQQDQVVALNRSIATLSDQMRHDSFLSKSLHEILTTAAAIRSTASILNEPGDMDHNWQRRFQENIFQDSKRLAQASSELVGYLDSGPAIENEPHAPNDQFQQILNRSHHHVAALEHPSASIEQVLDSAFADIPPDRRSMGKTYLEQYQADANRLPMVTLLSALDQHGLNPGQLAIELQIDLPLLFRRLAQLPSDSGWPNMGCFQCDGAGVFTFQKRCGKFALESSTPVCGLWPIFASFAKPSVPAHESISWHATSDWFECYSIALPRPNPDFAAPPIFEATMLIIPSSAPDAADGIVLGAGCELCTKSNCFARRAGHPV